jgi:hypothetical protein
MAGPVIAGGDATGSVPRTAMPPCNLCSGTARWQASRRTAVVVDAPAAVGPNPYTTDLRHMSSAVADTPICFGRPDSRRPRGPRRSWPPGWDHPQIVSYPTPSSGEGPRQGRSSRPVRAVRRCHPTRERGAVDGGAFAAFRRLDDPLGARVLAPSPPERLSARGSIFRLACGANVVHRASWTNGTGVTVRRRVGGDARISAGRKAKGPPLGDPSSRRGGGI